MRRGSADPSPGTGAESAALREERALLRHVASQVLTSKDIAGNILSGGERLSRPDIDWARYESAGAKATSQKATFCDPNLFVLLEKSRQEELKHQTPRIVVHAVFLNQTAATVCLFKNEKCSEIIDPDFIFHASNCSVAEECTTEERFERRSWLLNEVLVGDSEGFFCLSTHNLDSSGWTMRLRQALEEIVQDECWRLELKFDANTGEIQSQNTQHLWYASPAAILSYRVLLQLAEAESTPYANDEPSNAKACAEWWLSISVLEREAALKKLFSLRNDNADQLYYLSALLKSQLLALYRQLQFSSDLEITSICGILASKDAFGDRLLDVVSLWPLARWSGRITCEAHRPDVSIEIYSDLLLHSRSMVRGLQDLITEWRQEELIKSMDETPNEQRKPKKTKKKKKGARSNASKVSPGNGVDAPADSQCHDQSLSQNAVVEEGNGLASGSTNVSDVSSSTIAAENMIVSADIDLTEPISITEDNTALPCYNRISDKKDVEERPCSEMIESAVERCGLDEVDTESLGDSMLGSSKFAAAAPVDDLEVGPSPQLVRTFARHLLDEDDSDSEDERAAGDSERYDDIKNEESDTLPNPRPPRPPSVSDSQHRPLDLIQEMDTIVRMDHISDDIVEMAAMLKTVADRRRPWQGGALARVRELTKTMWPAAEVHVFGSYESGIAIPPSDIDVVVSGVDIKSRLFPKSPSPSPLAISSPSSYRQGISVGGSGPLSPLEALARELSNQDWCANVTTLPSATVPLIKVQTASVPTRYGRMSVIQMDITFVFGHVDPDPSAAQYPPDLDSWRRSFSEPPVYLPEDNSPTLPSRLRSPGSALRSTAAPSGGIGSGGGLQTLQRQHTGIENTRFVVRLLALHPPLTPLILVLKQLLYERGLSDPYKGGLGAFALTIMCASVVQQHALQPPTEKPSVGMLLVSFLKLYSPENFNPRNFCVSLSPAGPLLPLAPNQFNTPRVGSAVFWQPAPPVVILDPLNPTANIGSSCYGFKQVQLCFEDALHTILNCPIPRGVESSVSTESVLGKMFGATHHKQVVELSASIWCPMENQYRSSTADEDAKADESTEDNLKMGAGFVNPLTSSELSELKALLGRAQPLTIVETRRVQTLMKQTQRIDRPSQNGKRLSPDPVDPAPRAMFSEETPSGEADQICTLSASDESSKKERRLDQCTDDDLRQKCQDRIACIEDREELLKLATLLLST